LGWIPPGLVASLDWTPPKHPDLERERQDRRREVREFERAREAVLAEVKRRAQADGRHWGPSHVQALALWNTGGHKADKKGLASWVAACAGKGLISQTYRAQRAAASLIESLTGGGG
jgi:hypothetical protein